jgi:beta-galactosidase
MFNSAKRTQRFLLFLILSLFAIQFTRHSECKVLFSSQFAPQEGLVSPPELPFRKEICLNGLWRFQPISIPANFQPGHGAPPMPLPTRDAWDSALIRIPSPWNVNSFSEGTGGDFRCFPSYPKSWEKAQMGWLRRDFNVPKNWRNRRVLLDFEAVAGSCDVYVNGIHLAHHFDSFLPFKVDITDAVHWQGSNLLLVGVQRPDLFDVSGAMGRFTYPTGSFWGMHIVGIWQDVYLESVPDVYISNVQVDPHVSQNRLLLNVQVRNDTSKPMRVDISGEVRKWISLAGKNIIDAPVPEWRLDKHIFLNIPVGHGTIPPNSERTIMLSEPVNGRLAYWSPSSPNLYGLVVTLKHDDRVADRRYERFGWRQFSFKGAQLLLNGKPIQLYGDAWHFMGVPEMSRRYAWAWFKMLKDAHGNAVRLHAEPYPSFFLDVADEMGICVLDESGIWASHCAFNYDDPDTWRRFQTDVEDLVRRDRNHASVYGWSVANEINPALGVDRASPAVVSEVDDKIASLVHRIQELDPTRSWISSDGDESMNGRLPVISNHYGDLSTFQSYAKNNIPWAVGEDGSAYFATPAQASQWSGDIAYKSVKGRMDGIAIEDYGLIKDQRKYGAAYCSIFNIVWYGLQPLPIGLANIHKPLTLEDGIVFGPYIPGKPGMQPERLGAYSTTLNPGYDPHLPLYKPWPLFNAVQAAYTPAGPKPCIWDHKWVTSRPSAPPVNNPVNNVGFLGDTGGPLFYSLQSAGIPVEDANHNTAAYRIMVVDGESPGSVDSDVTKRRIDSVLSHSGTVLIWGIPKKNPDILNRLLPEPVAITDRQAVSLIPVDDDPITTSIPLGALYFNEDSSIGTIMDSGMDGPFVTKGHVLLEACNTDWRRWNDNPENIKTASVFRSEAETKPGGAALVENSDGNGKLFLCSLQTQLYSPQRLQLLRTLMGNMGAELTSWKPGEQGAPGEIRQALVIGGFPATSYDAALDTDFIGGETTSSPVEGDSVGALKWHAMSVNGDNLFDLLPLQSSGVDFAAYLSFWVYSPRSLDQLLSAPNVPKVNLLAGSDDGDKIWLNGKLLMQNRGIGPLMFGSQRVEALPLKKGWNHFMVKAAQAGGKWQFQARLQCADLNELRGLRIVATPAN